MQPAMAVELARLFIYPVKSLGGIELQRCAVTRRGLARDRRYMVVDPDGTFVTQRELGALARIRTVLHGEQLQLHAPHGDAWVIPERVTEGPARQVRVFDDTLEGLDVGDGVATWLSRAVGRSVRLVFMPDATRRSVDPRFAAPDDEVSFADGFPYLIVGEASLADLNTRLESPVTVQRFRPNLVVRGSEAYAEDRWHEVRIGEVPFRLVKPCSRCVITTLDPTSGERAGPDPLKALAQYRRASGKVYFAQNALVDSDQGELRVGDRIEVQSLRPTPTYDASR